MDEYLTYLDSQGMGYVKNYVKECQNQVYLTDDLIEASKKARQVQLDQNQAIRQSTAAYKIAATAKKAFAMAGNMAAMWAISKAISVVTKTVDELVHAQENLENSAGSLGSELSSKTADIGSYKDKIKELYQTIQDDSSSISEVTQARVNLMAVQDELIDKFGAEKGAIENITQAISGQTAALDELSRQSYFQAKNEFNKKTGGQKFGDWITFGNTNDNRVQSNMDTMIHQMESHFYQLKTTGNEVLDSLIAKSYGLNIMDDMYGNGQHFQLMGSLEEIQQKLYGIQVMTGDFEVSPAFENSFTDISTEVDTSLAKFRDLYGQYVLWEKILNASADNPYDEQFHLINTAKESYNEAVLSGNEENISQMGDHYAVILTDAMKLAMENNDKDVADYFRAMYPELRQIVGNWQFRVDLEADSDGLKANLSEILDMTDGASDGVTSFSAEDFENFNPSTTTREQIDAYGELIHMADSYGLTLSQLIQYLQQLGLVQSEAYQSLVTLFGKDNVDKISQDDLTFAYEIEDAGKLTFEEFQEEIQKLKDLADESVPIPYENLTKSAEHAANAVAALRSSLTAVNDAFGEQAENGGISVDTMLSLVDAGYAAALEFDAVTGACSLNRDAMLDLVQTKIQNQILDLESLQTDIQTRLAADGNAASQAANGFYDLVRAKTADAAVDQIMAMEQFNSAGAQINALQNALSNLDKIGSGSYTTSFKPGSGSGKGASQDPLRDAFTREYNTLKHSQEMESITSKEYYDSLDALNRKYFAGKKEYLEEYRKYEKEVLDGLRAYNKEMTEARMNLSEKQLDAGIISYEDYCKTVISLIDEMYAQDRISAEDHFDYMQKVMEKQLGIYDKVLSSVNRRLDKEIDKNQAVIDGLEQENDALEKQQDRYDKIISAIHNTLQARKEEVQSRRYMK